MVRAIIIDDEPDGCEAIRMVLAKHCPEVAVQRICNHPEAGLNAINNLDPDLVFLDIQMPGMTGFDLLQRLTPFTFKVIFVTAYDSYAIKAIKFSALDYLLKPIDAEELTAAVEKVKQSLDQENNRFKYQAIANNLQHISGKINRIAVPTLDGIEFFNTDDIVFCRADGSYTSICLEDGNSCLISKNLREFEHLLMESGFYRVHHSFLVNMKHVQKYIKGEGGYIIMSGGYHVDVSRRKKEGFLNSLHKI